MTLAIPESITKSRLPSGATCSACSNYLPFCRSALAGQSPFDGKATICYWGEAKLFFNVDILAPSDFIKNRRKTR